MPLDVRRAHGDAVCPLPLAPLDHRDAGALLRSSHIVQVDHYDAVIIGAGQAGVPLGIALAQAGGRTALIEREHVGGTCVNEGCTPSKTMVASARVVYLARRGPHYGIETDPMAEVDMVTVRGRKRAIVERFRSSSEHRLAQCPGLDLFRGEASFTGPRSLVVQLSSGQRQEIAAETIFINTGQRPTMPLLMGLDGVPALTSTTIMALDAVPEHLLILGGGYVGVEFSQMFRRFGSEVTIVQRGAQLLAREDPDVAAAVTEILREDGIEVLLDSTAVHVEGMADERVWLHLRTPQDERTLLGSHLLVATGRTPNTEALNLWLAGVATDARGYVRVNERLETTAPGIYALGDVTGEPAFTHVSYDDYRIIRANLLEGGNRTTRERLVLYTVFIDPELGRVGLSEQEARNQGRAIRVARMPMSAVARALEVAESRGLIKAGGRCRQRPDSGLRGVGAGGRRNRGAAAGSHAGPAALYAPARWHLHASDAGRGPEHTVCAPGWVSRGH